MLSTSTVIVSPSPGDVDFNETCAPAVIGNAAMNMMNKSQIRNCFTVHEPLFSKIDNFYRYDNTINPSKMIDIIDFVLYIIDNDDYGRSCSMVNRWSSTKKRGIKMLLFGVTLSLFFLGAAGFVYAQTPSSAPPSEQLTDEQAHYRQLTYAANEMNNQLNRWRDGGGKAAARLHKDKAYVDALVSALQEPPEDQIVTQRIVEDLYHSYSDIHRALYEGNGASYKEFEENFQLFLENSAIVRMLNQYQGDRKSVV